jgi:signal transduction histidine kinase/CheY-like chemotaxis protein
MWKALPVRGLLAVAGACFTAAACVLMVHASILEGLIGAALAALIVFWQDLKIREIERGLDRADRAKRDFLANVNHEIRTPLNAIQSTAEFLVRNGPNTELRQMGSLIQANCETLVSLMNEILETSNTELGSLRVENVPFDLQAAVDSVAGRIARRAQAKRLSFAVTVRPDVPRQLMGDPQRVRQVLMHLLDNAIKFTEEGSVALNIAPVGRPTTALLFRVTDTGPGIDPDLAEELLAPFTQGDSGSSRRHGGMGLGLTLAHRLVTLMGGSVGVESNPGYGSTFWFLLPARLAPREVPRKMRSGHILIVDDNPVNQMVAARSVHNLGYTSQVVADGKAALEAFAAARFDLVLMDCQMPGMDGYETTRRIRRHEAATPGRHVPVVAMTANAGPGDRDQCLESGMDDYLTKPVRMTVLARSLERWIPERRPNAPGAPDDAPQAVRVELS